MKKFTAISALLLTLAPFTAGARSYSLSEVIAMAQDSTIAARESYSTLLRAQWEHAEFLATRKPQLNFVLEPNYQKYTFEPMLHYYKLRNYNMLNTYGELRLEQQAFSIGGNFYAGSSFLWTEYMAGSSEIPRLFSTIPIDVGYTNQLIGYNGHKWDKLINDYHIQSEEKAYRYKLADIALNAQKYFIDYYVSKSLYDIYNTNATVFAQMLEIGREKFAMASISKNELSSLQLQYLNAQNTLSNAVLKLQTARANLLSYLNLEDTGQELSLEEPELPGQIYIEREEALRLAKENNPSSRERKEEILKAKQREAKAKVQAFFLQSALDLSVGIQSTNQTFASAYSAQRPFFIGGLTLRIPIFDGGLAKSRRKAAEYELQRAKDAREEEGRKLDLEVGNALNEFNFQQDLIQRTAQALELADDSFELARELYSNGETDINTLILAQARKDEAHENYLNSLKSYWDSYYNLQKLCVSDLK